MSRLRALLNSIKVRDSKLVTEGVVSILEEKTALRLAEERKTIAKTTLTEEKTQWQCMDCGKKLTTKQDTCPKCGGEDIDVYVPGGRDRTEIREEASALQCQECGKTFKKAVSAGSEPKCPKCGSYDVDLKEAKQIAKTSLTEDARSLLRVREVEDNDVWFSSAKDLAYHNPDDAAQILALKKGQKLRIGGGAGPTYEITVEHEYSTEPKTINGVQVYPVYNQSGKLVWVSVPKESFEGAINESHMPVTEVQRVYDETGDIGETEILCGIKNLMISQSGQVVAYISEEVTKKALIREPGYPEGHPAPLYINCACGAKIPGVGHGDVECPTCKQKYDEKGYLKEAFTFPNLSLAHANNRSLSASRYAATGGSPVSGGASPNVPGAPANWAAGFSREWQIGAGGTEVPFVYNGKWFLYVWNVVTRKHAYYSYSDDTFVDAFNEDWSPEAREAAAEARRKAHGEIQHANSSGQGFHPKHTENPHHETLTKHGYAYSHTTPVGSPSGKWTMHHTYKKGDHNVGVSGHHANATWEASKSGSGRAHFGKTSADLHKYLKNRK